jgi:hypothetical protein
MLSTLVSSAANRSISFIPSNVLFLLPMIGEVNITPVSYHYIIDYLDRKENISLSPSFGFIIPICLSSAMVGGR